MHVFVPKPVPTFGRHALILLRHKIWWRVFALAAWTSSELTCQGDDEALSKGGDGVWHVSFGPDRGRPWVLDEWER